MYKNNEYPQRIPYKLPEGDILSEKKFNLPFNKTSPLIFPPNILSNYESLKLSISKK